MSLQCNEVYNKCLAKSRLSVRVSFSFLLQSLNMDLVLCCVLPLSSWMVWSVAITFLHFCIVRLF